jgi:hypothetical protein
MFTFRSALIACILAAAPARAAEVDQLLPARTELVVSVNLRQILDSPVVKKHVLPEVDSKVAQELFQVVKLVNLLGLNPIKDVASFTVASPGDPDGGDWVVIVRGTFDVRRLHAAADQWAQSRPGTVTVHEDEKIRIYEDLTQKDKAAPRFYALLDSEVAVISPSKARVLEVLARRTAKEPAKANAGLAELAGKQNNKQCIWIASVTSDGVKKNLNGPLALAGKVVSLGGGVTLTEDIQLNLRVQMSDTRSAREMRQQLEALKAIAILAISVNDDLKDYGPVLMDVLNAIALSQEQGTIGVDLKISGSTLERGTQAGKKP